MRRFLITAGVAVIITSGVGVGQATAHATRPATYPRYCTMHPIWVGCPKHNPLMPGSGRLSPVFRNNLCCAMALASAHIDWFCALQGGVLGAGILIAFPLASPAWATLSSALWTYGCSVVDSYYLDQNQVSALRQWMTNTGCVAGWRAYNRAGRSGGDRNRWVYKCSVWAV